MCAGCDESRARRSDSDALAPAVRPAIPLLEILCGAGPAPSPSVVIFRRAPERTSRKDSTEGVFGEVVAALCP